MLTQIQRDAIARAQAGDFALADAMELACPDRRYFRDFELLGGVAIGGRLRQLVYGDQQDCEDCCGTGETTCTACRDGSLTCSECDGEGEVECPDCNGGAECTTGKKDCTECKGDGDVDCPDCGGDGTTDCPTCDGSGERVLVEYPDGQLLVDLNNRVLANYADDPEHWYATLAGINRTRKWADKVLAEYHNPPKPKPAPDACATQGVLIPEAAAA